MTATTTLTQAQQFAARFNHDAFSFRNARGEDLYEVGYNECMCCHAVRSDRTGILKQRYAFADHSAIVVIGERQWGLEHPDFKFVLAEDPHPEVSDSEPHSMAPFYG